MRNIYDIEGYQIISIIHRKSCFIPLQISIIKECLVCILGWNTLMIMHYFHPSRAKQHENHQLFSFSLFRMVVRSIALLCHQQWSKKRRN